jgi:hypothetical protein
VTGHSRHTVSNTVRGIINKNPVRWDGLAKYQFPGSGQTPREVVSAEEAFQFLMVLRGKAADKIREEFSGLLGRLYAGDPTLKDVIDQHALSDGVVNQFARAGMGGDKAAVGQADKVNTLTDEETQLTKKIHLATMRQQLDDIERKRTVSQFEHVDWISKQCVTGAPESQKMWMQESNRNYKISVFNTTVGASIGGGSLGIENGPVYTDEMQPVTISTHIIIPKGLKDPDNKMAMGIGTIAAAMYGDWNEGQKPLKERAIIKGYPVEVNKYFKKDIPLLEAAFVVFEEKTSMAASQKLDKARRAQEKEEAKEIRQAEERLFQQEKATEKAVRELEKKMDQIAKERQRVHKEQRRQMEKDAVDVESKRKSDLLANQPSICEYWNRRSD